MHAIPCDPHGQASPSVVASIQVAGRARAPGASRDAQRFRSLAWRLARELVDTARILGLYGWILRRLAAEFREDPAKRGNLAVLVEHVRVLVEERFVPEELAALRAEVEMLTPRRRRRRSVHCHGWIASDRTLLPTLNGIGTRARWFGVDDTALALSIELTVAYYVTDYDHDHFVMTGPAVAERFWLMALWCQGNMPGDGLDVLRTRPPV